MNQGPSRSWASSILGFALAVLLASAALHLAARLLLEALPVLLPACVTVFLVYVWWQRHSGSDRW